MLFSFLRLLAELLRLLDELLVALRFVLAMAADAAVLPEGAGLLLVVLLMLLLLLLTTGGLPRLSMESSGSLSSERLITFSSPEVDVPSVAILTSMRSGEPCTMLSLS